MHWPKISIVTPSYNQVNFIEATILSVLNQGYPNLEYIIIDGGSTDGSVDVIRRHADSITYWISEPDRGFGDAINKGFRKASGEIFYWINSDDILLPGALKIVGAAFARYAKVGMLFGDRWVIDVDSRLVRKTTYFFYVKGLLTFDRTIPQECTFWRKEFFWQVGGIDESLKYAIDVDLWCKLSQVTRVKYLPFFLGAFRRQPDQKSSTIYAHGRVEVANSVLKHFGKKPSPIQSSLFNMFLGFSRRLLKYSGLHQLRIVFYKQKLSID
jgi:glycosyltransferase involved in cell wall biosynthesis